MSPRKPSKGALILAELLAEGLVEYEVWESSKFELAEFLERAASGPSMRAAVQLGRAAEHLHVLATRVEEHGLRGCPVPAHTEGEETLWSALEAARAFLAELADELEEPDEGGTP